MVRLYILKVFVFIFLSGNTQTIIAVQDFESLPAAPAWNYSSSGGSVSSTNTGTPVNSRIRNGASSFQSSNTASILTFDAVNTSSFSQLKIVVHVSSISGTASNGADAADYVRVFTALNGNAFATNTEANADIAVNGNSNSRWSYSATGPITDAGVNTIVNGSAGTNQGTIQSTITIHIPNGTNSVGLRINTLNNDANEIWCIDDIEITGTPDGGSSITVLSSVSLFSSVTGVPSSQQSYTVSGTGLTSDIIIVAPDGFEISTTSGSGYTSSIILSQNAGIVAVTTVYIRINSNNVGPISGIISHTSATVIQNLSVNGNLFANEPLIPSTVSFSNVLAGSMTVNFTGGDGTKRLVVMSSMNPVTSLPIDGIVYIANSQFGTGSMINNAEYVVFTGNGNSVSVSGLNAGTTYHVAVFEYNDAGIAAATNYLLVAGTGSQLTVIAPEGLQITTTDLEYRIDFDNTVAGVNNGKYNASGFTTNPAEGQLNSNAWAVTGWTDGSLAFGGIRTTTSTDYTRGNSAGGVSTGGMYSFQTSTGNAALGFQPGGTDWAPGTISLKIQNQTGITVHSIAVAYKLFVRNDQGRSSSFNFSWSTDHINYTEVTSMNFASPAEADALPTWLQNNRSSMISSISIAPGAYFYLRWSGSDAGGSGTRDEFALDDITISFNPLNPIVLAVKFDDLKATVQKNKVEVQWTNLTEFDIKTYLIEKADEANNFKVIGEMPAKANDGNSNTYSFIDHNPSKQSNLYRIRSVEYSGNEILSSVIRVNLNHNTELLSIYPNPHNSGSMSLQLPLLSPGKYQILIYNNMGQLLDHKLLIHNGARQSFTISTLQYQPGIYFLKLKGPVTLETIFIKN